MAFGDNANDTYTETETISYGSRISSSFGRERVWH